MLRIRPISLLVAVAILGCFAVAAMAADSAAPAKAKVAKGAAAAPAKAAAAAPAAGDATIKAIDAQIAAAKVNKGSANWRMSLPKPTVATFDKTHKYFWRMVTNKGTMVFQFKPDVAPMHVTNFIYLTRMGFFDGLKFHRVIQGFMAQGGDPAGNGTGGPGYAYNGEVSPSAKHDKAGILSTANAGPNTDGSQFFVMFRAYPSLDMKYSIFGELVEGFDVLKKLEAAGNPGDGPPTEPLSIVSASVEVK